MLVLLTVVGCGNKTDYRTWTKEDWGNASEKEKENCSYFVIGEVLNLTDEMIEDMKKNNDKEHVQNGIELVEDVFSETPDATIGDIVTLFDSNDINILDEATYTDKSEYLTWTKADWENASDEDKRECVILLTEKILNIDAETIRSIDEDTLNRGILEIETGINQLFSSGVYDSYTIEEFIDIMQGK